MFLIRASVAAPTVFILFLATSLVQADMGSLWVASVSPTSVHLNWSNPTGNHVSASGSGVVYRIRWTAVNGNDRGGDSPFSPDPDERVFAYEVSGLEPDTVYEFRLETLAWKINSAGEKVNAWYRLAGLLQQRTSSRERAPNVVVTSATDHSIGLRIAGSEDLNPNILMLRFAYKKSYAEASTILLRDTARQLAGPSYTWGAATEICGWVDILAYQESAVAFPDPKASTRTGHPPPALSVARLERGTEYVIVVYGFNLTDEIGVEIGQVRARTAGNQPVATVEDAIRTDHPGLLEDYSRSVNVEDLSARIAGFDGVRAQILVDEGIDIDRPSTTIDYAIREAPAAYQQWQQSVAFTVSSFLRNERDPSYEELLFEIDPTPPTFRRGDFDSDGVVNLTDAIGSFGFLFFGGEAPACADGADFNDDGELDLSDGLFLLGHLFLGKTAPPLPGMTACGIDPTPDDVDCVYYTGC